MSIPANTPYSPALESAPTPPDPIDPTSTSNPDPPVPSPTSEPYDHSISLIQALEAQGPSIRSIDYASLDSQEKVCKELTFVVDDLREWLAVVERGLGEMLSVADGGMGTKAVVEEVARG